MQERSFATLADAIASGLVLIDIRNADEIASMPIAGPSQWVPMHQLLDDAGALGCVPDAGRPDEGYLLVCARGQRSAHVVAHLRQQGIANAWSLTGGLAAFRNA